MNVPALRPGLRMLEPVVGPASKHWSVVAEPEGTVHVGTLVKVSYEPYEVSALDPNGDVHRRATFQHVMDAVRWLDRYCRIPSDAV